MSKLPEDVLKRDEAQALKEMMAARIVHPRLKDISNSEEREAWKCGFGDGFKACAESERAKNVADLEGYIRGLEISINVQSMDDRQAFLDKAKAKLDRYRGGK